MKKSLVIVCTILVFWLFFIPSSFTQLNSTIDGWIKNAITLFLIVLNYKSYKLLYRGNYRYINWTLIAFCIISIISVKHNISFVQSLDVSVYQDDIGMLEDVSGTTNIKGVIFKSLSLIAVALFIESISIKRLVPVFLKTLLYCFVIIVLIGDINALQIEDVEAGKGYLLGDKFILSYYNLFLCTIYYLNFPKLIRNQKIILFFLISVSIVISVFVQCSTMIIGAIVFWCIIFLCPKKLRYTLREPLLIVLILLACDLCFFLFSTWILSFGIVEDFIVNVLHEDITLTGRLGIYTEIVSAFQQSPLFGFGSGNSFIISEYYADAPDAQNGLIDLFLQCGILGCSAFVLLIWLTLQQVSKKDWYVFPIIPYVYAMLVVSMVEIPFNDFFIFFILLLLLKRPKLQKDKKNILRWNLSYKMEKKVVYDKTRPK